MKCVCYGTVYVLKDKHCEAVVSTVRSKQVFSRVLASCMGYSNNNYSIVLHSYASQFNDQNC